MAEDRPNRSNILETVDIISQHLLAISRKLKSTIDVIKQILGELFHETSEVCLQPHFPKYCWLKKRIEVTNLRYVTCVLLF